MLTDWSVVVLAFAVCRSLDTPLAYWVASLVIGNRIHALAIMGHDGAHHTASSDHRINDLLANLFIFWPFGVCVKSYRAFHFEHHRRVGTELDPELALKGSSPGYDTPMSRQSFVLYIVRDLLGISCLDAFRIIWIIRARGKDLVMPALLHLAVLGIAAAAGAWWSVALWWFSVLTSFLACFRMRSWTEHIGTDRTHRVEVSWLQSMVFAPHWTWLHFEHHEWPSTPCWLLPRARELDTVTPILSIKDLVELLAE